ncbi:MAG: hypothetical protein ABIQ39_15395 [Ilumatobacteraceae bacterium]
MHYPYVAAFAAAICYGISAVLEERAAKNVPITGRSGKRAALRAAIHPVYVAGMALSIVAWILALYSLRSLPLFAVQAIAASSIGIVVLITWAIGGIAPTRRDVGLLIVLAAGLVMLAISAAPGHPHRVAMSFKLGIWIGVVVVAVAAMRATSVSGTRGAALLGAVSGFADGGMALCARAVHHHTVSRWLTDPVAWALIPYTIIGIITFAGALQRGAASVALACQQAVTTVVPSAIGLVVLGDKARKGFAPLTYAGFVITVVAVITLTLDTHTEAVPSLGPSLGPS